MSENLSEWKFQSLKIDRVRYGDNEGKYDILIKFENNKETIQVEIPKEQADKIVQIISEQVVIAANNLSDHIKSVMCVSPARDLIIEAEKYSKRYPNGEE